jgi:hypothetical protein
VTVGDTVRDRALAPRIRGLSVDDANVSPVLVLKGERFGSKAGEVAFDDQPLRVVRWSDDVAIVAAPVPIRSGRLVLRSQLGESDPLQLTIVSGAPKPPKVTLINDTPFALQVDLEPEFFGSRRRFSLPPRGRETATVEANRYRMSVTPSGSPMFLSNLEEIKSFEESHEYTLRYMPSSFPSSRIEIQNQTGKPLRFVLRGRLSRTITVPPGAHVVEAPPGDYEADVSSWCGATHRAFQVREASVQRLTYGCR